MEIRITSKDQLEKLFENYQFNDNYPKCSSLKGGLPRSFSTQIILDFPPYNNKSILDAVGMRYIDIYKDEDSGNYYLTCVNDGGHFPLCLYYRIDRMEQLYDVDQLIFWYKNFGENFGRPLYRKQSASVYSPTTKSANENTKTESHKQSYAKYLWPELQIGNGKVYFDENIKEKELKTENGDSIKFLGFYYIIRVKGNYSSEYIYFFVEYNSKEEVILYNFSDGGEGWFVVSWNKEPEGFFSSDEYFQNKRDGGLKEIVERICFKYASEEDKQFVDTLERLLINDESVYRFVKR